MASTFTQLISIKNMSHLKYILKIIIIILINECTCKNKPNIIIILADDVGWNDFSFHGSSQYLTPNIDALGYNGVFLNKHYTLHTCTPSRVALLTGNYPIKSGMQGKPLSAGEPRSIPLSMPTIAEKLLELNYTTHLIGKWHVGHHNRSVLPLGRGFQTHLGYWSGFAGYFDYRVLEDNRFDGFDLHNGYYPALNSSGIYATNLFTDEAIKIIKSRTDKPFFLILSHLAGHTGKNGTALEIPNIEEAMKKYWYIEEPSRRIYAEIISRLDQSVGKIVKSLDEEKILQETIIIFMSDNGAITKGYYENHGSNWPLRGLKHSLFEGGVRNTAIIWSSYLKRKNIVDNNIFHIVDWLPTIYAAAGGNVSNLGKIDGVSQWTYLSTGNQQERDSDVLLNIDEKNNYEAIISSDGKYKLIKGTYRNYTFDSYFGDSGRSNNTPSYNISSVLTSAVNTAILNLNDSFARVSESIVVNLRSQLQIKQFSAERNLIKCVNYCLFDLLSDPTETTDIASRNFEIVDKLTRSLDEFRKKLIPQVIKGVDFKANPIYCFDTYHPWLDPLHNCTV